jgi:lantibiotic modifying enzyme
MTAGEELLSAAEITEAGILWRIPTGYGGMSGKAHIGYAHGASGIADALLYLFEATGDERCLRVAIGAAKSLSRTATPFLVDESGVNWPTFEGGERNAGFWCHGATGVGKFFLHIAQGQYLTEGLSFAERAALSAAYGARWAGATQCHGLSGNIEFLLDMFQATGNNNYLTEAYTLASLLRAFAIEREEGLVWMTEYPDVVSPGYMTGYAGVAACLLRLANPQLPHLFSRRGFRWGVTPPPKAELSSDKIFRGR